MTILLTGVAGFIGRHVAGRLLDAGCTVCGIDNLNPYYDPALKRGRLRALLDRPGFRFHEADIADPGALEAALPATEAELIVHLAAQAGVRHSLTAPFDYERANVAGHLRVLEYARFAPRLKQLVYASSSSVYGDRSEGPFREDDRCDAPNSLYAATKRSCELMSETYARTFGLPQVGLRFFTVYGPWGRPDMAYWMFTESVLAGRPIAVYGGGKLARDFTYVDDIVDAVAAIALGPRRPEDPVHGLYNLGNAAPNTVLDLVAAVEAATGRRADMRMEPVQPGDVTTTFADISKAAARFGFAPKTSLRDGIARFVDWWRAERG